MRGWGPVKAVPGHSSRQLGQKLRTMGSLEGWCGQCPFWWLGGTQQSQNLVALSARFLLHRYTHHSCGMGRLCFSGEGITFFLGFPILCPAPSAQHTGSLASLPRQTVPAGCPSELMAGCMGPTPSLITSQRLLSGSCSHLAVVRVLLGPPNSDSFLCSHICPWLGCKDSEESLPARATLASRHPSSQ